MRPLIVALLLLLCPFVAVGQEGQDAPVPEEGPGVPVGDGEVPGEGPEGDPEELSRPPTPGGQVATLQTLIAYIEELRQKVGERELVLKGLEEGDRKAEVKKEVARLRLELEELERNFDQIATGVDLGVFLESPDQRFDLERELMDLVSPLVRELKAMTKKPRKIEKLRLELAHYQERQPTVQKAVENISGLRQEVGDPEIDAELGKIEALWRLRGQQIDKDVAVTKLQLEELTKEKRSLFESSQDLVKIFFKSRGRNLMFALGSIVGVFIVMRLLYRLLTWISPVHRKEGRPFYVRLMDVTYHVLTFVGSIFAAVVVLYVSGDWVLLSLAVLLMIGVFWAARQTIPKYWAQVKTLLNIGSVREGERIVFNGVPYRITRLNLYSHLENPVLDNCRIRLPIEDLVELHSRPYGADEPWFPTRREEWVILADGTYGQVLHQTQEMVQLRLAGGALKTYQTSGFLGQSPRNISQGFRVSTTFGVDYGLQAQATQDIPNLFAEVLRERLTAEGYARWLTSLVVEFKAASSSSLDYAVMVDMHGDAAPRFYNLERALQRICVEVCNEYGWSIPFPQMTVHTRFEQALAAQVSMQGEVRRAPRPAPPKTGGFRRDTREASGSGRAPEERPGSGSDWRGESGERRVPRRGDGVS